MGGSLAILAASVPALPLVSPLHQSAKGPLRGARFSPQPALGQPLRAQAGPWPQAT